MYVYKSTEVRKYHEVDTNEAVQHTTTTLYNYTYTATTPNRSPTVRVQLYTYFRKYSILSYLRRYTHVREGTRTVRVQCTLLFPLNKRGVQRAVNCTAVHVQRCTTALRVYVNRIRVQLHTVVLSKVLKVSYEDMYCTVGLPSKVRKYFRTNEGTYTFKYVVLDAQRHTFSSLSASIFCSPFFSDRFNPAAAVNSSLFAAPRA